MVVLDAEADQSATPPDSARGDQHSLALQTLEMHGILRAKMCQVNPIEMEVDQTFDATDAPGVSGGFWGCEVYIPQQMVACTGLSNLFDCFCFLHLNKKLVVSAIWEIPLLPDIPTCFVSSVYNSHIRDTS